MRILIITLILLAPISAIAAAVYEIVTGKQEPTLYLLLAVIPGALIAALKEIKDSGLLPPNRLRFKIEVGHTDIKKWSRKKDEGEQQVTSIVIPVRIENSDPNKTIDILDITVTAIEPQVVLHLPEMLEAKIGSERKWIYAVAGGGWSELFNDGKQKTIEARKIQDYVIVINEYEVSRDKYVIRIAFRDNWKRKYSKVVKVGIS